MAQQMDPKVPGKAFGSNWHGITGRAITSTDYIEVLLKLISVRFTFTYHCHWLQKEKMIENLDGQGSENPMKITQWFDRIGS